MKIKQAARAQLRAPALRIGSLPGSATVRPLRSTAMSLKDNLPSQAILMLAVALQELQQSEAETDLARIRDLITTAQSTLVELNAIAEKAAEEGDGKA